MMGGFTFAFLLSSTILTCKVNPFSIVSQAQGAPWHAALEGETLNMLDASVKLMQVDAKTFE